MGWFSKWFGNEEEVPIAVTLIAYGPVKEVSDKEASQPVEPTEHENQYYCGLCGWSDIRSFPHNH